MISSESAEKVTEGGKFAFAPCRKDIGSNFIFCQFCWCWMHKKCSGIRGK